MKIKSIDELLHEHPFFEGMRPEWLSLMSGCGHNVAFRPGELIASEGKECGEFYAVRRGKVAIEIHSPAAGSRTVQTLGDGAIIGWSWILPPHVWMFDVRAVETTHAVHFDATCLRTKCEESPEMGYEFMKRFAAVMSDRLRATRLQLLDVYGTSSDAHGPG
jgi:CRP-like cAMP-binding protein